MGSPWCDACGQRLPHQREIEWRGLRVSDDPPRAYWQGQRLDLSPSPTRLGMLRLLVEARGQVVPFAAFDALVGGVRPKLTRRVQIHNLRRALAASPAPFIIPVEARGADGYHIERV